MSKIKVLFVCVHNSARSQMAEAFLNTLGGDRFQAESAGFEPGILNPTVVEVMKEVGIDISQNKTESVFDFYKSGKLYSYVITVCDEASGEKCPIFPRVSKKLHWEFPDPSAIKGEDKIEQIRKIRDQVKAQIEKFIVEFK